MQNIREHLDKNNLHHAYLIEGERKEATACVQEFCKEIGVGIIGNPDFSQITIDSLKIDDAFFLRSMSSDRSFAEGKKVFIVSVNSMTIDAQNVLLKMFEEPIPNTHFFVIVPDVNSLVKTLVSRFYLVRLNSNSQEASGEAEKFIGMHLKDRIDFIKDLLQEEKEEDEEGNPILVEDSARSRSLIFLNAVEYTLHDKMVKGVLSPSALGFFGHLFKVRKFLRMPGSSTKSLMESVAIIVPNF